MNTVLMAIAIIKDGIKYCYAKLIQQRILTMSRGLYLAAELMVKARLELINDELNERWDMNVSIEEKLWWDEEIKKDHDGETKHFVYLDALCSISSGRLTPLNHNEQLEWVDLSDLTSYSINPPSVVVLKKLSYL